MVKGTIMAGETREKILDAAERLIQLKGLARVTTKEIARETGLSEGALYRHFDHKEEIFFAIMMKYMPAYMDVLQTHQPGTATVRENLIAIALGTINYYERIVPMGASFLGDTELLAQLRKAIRQTNGGPQNVNERVANYISEEQQLERLEKGVAAPSIADLLLGACFQRVFVNQFLGYDPYSKTDQQFVEELVQGLTYKRLLS
jgi:AcrR family transcriptional regulator